ncbi:SDR family oxidoreductase [Mycolicibacterium sp.]|uniref:SDR family oxidoreductase n=1 Tax=Mycolicibacterium sp. TaxID=2320850 RepID=UPI0025D24194|nr:SDR family oxidoreductase [Mycolicibacterium sp.]MCB9409841.1 SDR family oxidoreductase [Mycolicibacterium sp.]
MPLSKLPVFDLSGRSALVTGGGGMLGPQHAAALAVLGARVFVADVVEESAKAAAQNVIAETGNDDVVGCYLDVTNATQIQDFSARIGPLDILVNNAAIDAKVTATPGVANGTRLEVLPLEQWRVEIDVGLTGAMLCSRTFGALMAARGRGVILNIASDLSVIAPDQRLYRRPDVLRESQQPVKPVTYSVIKHGLIGLTKYLATYWAHCGVRANALSPGGVFNGQGDDFTRRLSDLIPMGRMAQVDEYRSAVQFLCSDASSYMNGQNIVMDGGRSVL